MVKLTSREKVVKLIRTKEEFNILRSNIPDSEIGFVPTMGNLHKGHLSLIKKAAQLTEVIIVSIFVNPTQFGPNEDFDSYPRTLERDIKLIEGLSIEKNIIIFAPESMDEVYPQDFSTTFNIPMLESRLCGSSRPGHFSGVLSVIYHLFNLIKPQIAIFGQKDYQQYLIIKKFASDFFPSIKIVMSEIIREDSGLAMSSRNGYLSDEEKDTALELNKTLKKVKTDILSKKYTSPEEYKNNTDSISWDYLDVLDSNNLQDIDNSTRHIIISGAMFINKKVRIIDNILMEIQA